jgi:predicted nuclease of predicted toxin-antitoxin system
VKFLIDAQLPPALAGLLRKLGCDASHVEDVALQNASDMDIRDYALANKIIVVTKDRDFVPAETSGKLQVVWVRTGNITNRVLFQRIEAGWSDAIAHLNAGATIVEFR